MQYSARVDTTVLSLAHTGDYSRRKGRRKQSPVWTRLYVSRLSGFSFNTDEIDAADMTSLDLS